jgi:hypothetical protein
VSSVNKNAVLMPFMIGIYLPCRCLEEISDS